MSLTKTITTNTGHDASYWKIGSIHIMIDQRELEVMLNGYKDEAAFIAELKPVTRQRISVSQEALVDSGVTGLMSKLRKCIGAIEGVLVELDTEFAEAVLTESDTI